MKNFTKAFLKAAKFIAITSIGLAFLLAIITGANVLFFWSIFDWAQTGIRVVTGLDGQLAKDFAAIVIAAAVMLPFGKVVLSFTPIPQKRKGLYRSLIFIGMAAFFLFIYFGGKEIYFDVKTGKPLKYYSITPDGKYQFYTEPGFDPLTGDKLKAVTKEVALKSKGLLEKKHIDSIPKNLRTTNPLLFPTPISAPVSTITPTKEIDHKKNSYKPSTRKPKTSYNNYNRYDYKEVPKKADPMITQPIKEEFIYPAAETSISSISLNNQSSSTVLILDSNGRRIDGVNVACKLTIQLYPGNYYYQFYNSSDKRLFKVESGQNLSFKFMDRATSTIGNRNNPNNNDDVYFQQNTRQATKAHPTNRPVKQNWNPGRYQ